jgi:hypothetical protein
MVAYSTSSKSPATSLVRTHRAAVASSLACWRGDVHAAELHPLVWAHDRVIVLDHIVDGEWADSEPVGLKQLGNLEVRRQNAMAVSLSVRSSGRQSLL